MTKWRRDWGDWRLWTFAIWLGACVVFVWMRWSMIHWYALPDTDDNMRMAQVHALLAGQGWYDLRQYKLDPPIGFNMHWSRLVDLPIAAIELIVRPWGGNALAARTAAAIAPMIPFGIAMFGLGVTVRRLIAPAAFAVAAFVMLSCQAALLMFMPMRVDHHGWQLAMLVWTVAGLADPAARRGGLTMGLTSAVSLAIGLELMPFLVVCGAAVVLRWVADRDAGSARMRGYGMTLALGCALGYALFASYDNRVARCDVLSPVWLSTMIAAGAAATILASLGSGRWPVRLGAAALVGIALGLGFVFAWPQCLGRPEQISPELYDSWFKNIREAKPLYAMRWQTALTVPLVPVIGLAGSVWRVCKSWGTLALGIWGVIAFVSALSLLLCFWQSRNGAGAQLLAVPGATALIWDLAPILLAPGWTKARIGSLVAAGLIALGLVPALVIDRFAPAPLTPHLKAVQRANARCPTLPALRPIAAMPATTIFTFVDMGPRLINVTHHRAIAGPYHRNGDAILDVHHAFDGASDRARAIMLRHGATLLLTCPNMNESTVYRARSPDGFYARLARGETFGWLTPIPLPKGSPFSLWRIN